MPPGELDSTGPRKVSLMSSTTLRPTLIQMTNQTSDNLWTDKIYSKPKVHMNISFKSSSNCSHDVTLMQLYLNWGLLKGKLLFIVVASSLSIKSSNLIYIVN